MTVGRRLTALDIGSSKICCLIAWSDDTTLRVAGIGYQASAGIRAGAIVDMETARESIVSVVHAAERMAGVTVDDVAVNISGGDPESRRTRTTITIGGRQIQSGDVRRLMRDARPTETTRERALLHAIATSFDADDARGLQDPRGLHAQTLALNAHLLTVSASRIGTLNTCLGHCHLKAKDFVHNAYAAGLSTLVDDERNLGATVVDMGAGTTSIGIFHRGRLIHADSIPTGGGHVTADIAQALSTPLDEAERLKIRFGAAAAPFSHAPQGVLEAPQIGEERDTPNAVRQEDLVAVIAPRVEETLEMIRDRLRAAGAVGLTGRRVVLTGGACQLPGMRERATYILNRPTRLGRPVAPSGIAESASGPEFAAAIGLLKHAVGDWGALSAALAADAPKGLWTRIGRWLHDTF